MYVKKIIMWYTSSKFLAVKLMKFAKFTVYPCGHAINKNYPCVCAQHDEGGCTHKTLQRKTAVSCTH